MTARDGITIKGDKAVSRRFASMAGRAQDVTPAWPKVGNFLSREVGRQFASEGAHFGRKWKPLKSEYRLWKIRNGYSRRILQQTGAMKKTFTSRPMDIEEYRPQSATFGSSNQKAVWHQKGTRRHGRRVNPARPIFVVTRRVRKETRDIVADYIKGKS